MYLRELNEKDVEGMMEWKMLKYKKIFALRVKM